jgi:hypothetical protein
MHASISRPRGLLEAHIAERRLLLIAGGTSRGRGKAVGSGGPLTLWLALRNC